MALVGGARRGYTVGVNNPLLDMARAEVGALGAFHPEAARAGVLAVADDPEAARPWFEALQLEGLRAQALPAAGAGPQALRVDRGVPPLAVILHISRRLTDSLGTLRQLRAAGAALPLVVVCHPLRDLDHVLALEMGADDVVDAATSAAVVAARLRAVARRNASGATTAPVPEQLHFGALTLQLHERRVRLGSSDVALTEGEFALLWLLASHAGQPVSRADLLRRLRGLPYQRIDRSIDCRVYRIRSKLGDADGPSQRIRTVRNCGYLFSPAAW